MSSPAVKDEVWVKEQEAKTELSKDDILRAMNASTGEGPGRFLKQVRDMNGMGDMEIASRLNINMHQLHALEGDDFAQLPAPIYVRSYLRRYSEIFELPISDVMNAYERFGENREPDLARISQKVRAHAQPIPFKWVLYTVGAVILVVAFFVARSMGVGDWINEMSANNAEPSTQLELPINEPNLVDQEAFVENK